MKEILETERTSLGEKLSLVDKVYTKNKMSVRFGLGVADGETLLGRD